MSMYRLCHYPSAGNIIYLLYAKSNLFILPHTPAPPAAATSAVRRQIEKAFRLKRENSYFIFYKYT